MNSTAAVAATPSRLGAYRVTGLLGQGGMGVVFEGEHEKTGERVALKTVRVPSAAQLASLRREIQALSRLQHPGVVRIVAEGVRESLPWYAMELLRGPTLGDLIHRLWTARIHSVVSDQPTLLDLTRMARTTLVGGELEAPDSITTVPVSSDGPRVQAFAGEETRFLTIVRRLCDTLAFLHGEGIVHRDLKPENVFLRDDDTPVMVDFGLVGQRGEAGREVLDLQLPAGTPAYIAPEQLGGAVVDARADLYAVGCILYELATGRVPFDATTLRELRAKLMAAPTPPSLLVHGFPIALEDMILRLLAPLPRDRVGHAADVALALERLRAAPWPVPTPKPRGYVYRPALTGRTRALAEISHGIDGLKKKSGGLWLLRGESGIGKTYLALAAARDAAVAGVLPVVCTCQPIAVGAAGREAETTTDAPLRALAPLFRALADACVEHPERADEILGARSRILATCEPALADLPCFQAAPEPGELSQMAARERLLEALAQSLAALATLRPVLLLIDDMQWADELSVAFVASLSAAFFRERAVLVLGMYRSEETTAELVTIAARPDIVSLDVARLDEESVAAMVSDMLAQPHVPPSFAAFLTARSEGNPFFVVEYVRTAVAEGLLRRTESGGWRIPQGETSWEKLPLPTSLAALVERRLSGLTRETRGVLEAASVIGREVPIEVLARVTRLPEDALLAAVRELLLRQVIEDAPGGELRFVHDKIREVAYEAQDPVTRRALHAAAGAAIEAVRGAHHAASHSTLAHHYLIADDVPKAVLFLERAGAHALASFACREAAGFFQQLIALADRTAAGAPTPAEKLRRVRWERLLAEACFGLGDVNGILEHAERALRWAGLEPPASSRGWVASLARNVPAQIAHRLFPARFVAGGEIERAIAREASAAMQRLAQRQYFLDANAMIAGSLWSVNLAERAGGAAHVGLSYAMLGMASGIAGLRGPAARYFAIARQNGRDNHDETCLVEADYAEATWRSGSAEWPEVYRLLGAALDRAQRLGDRNQADIVQTVLANTDFFTGKFRESRARLEAVTQSTRRHPNAQHLAWGLYGAARAMLPLGELREATVLLEEAAQVLAPQAELPSKVICSALLAVVRLRSGDKRGALDAARTALARIAENRLAAYAIASAYADTAEVFLTLADVYPEAKNGARDVARAFSSLVLTVPLAAPYRERVRGRMALRDGDTAVARKAFERALAGAVRFGLPYEQARLHLWLARVARPGSTQVGAHRAAAERILTTLDCATALLEEELP